MKSKEEILVAHKLMADLVQGKLPVKMNEEAKEIISAQCAVLRWVVDWPEDQSFQISIASMVDCLQKVGWIDRRLRPKKHRVISLAE